MCSICKLHHGRSNFSNNQLRLDENTRKCRNCIANAQAAETAAVEAKRAKKIRELSDAASGNGISNVGAVLRAAAAECAAEAELVTGLKPLRGAGRRGRGRGRGRGSWRARARGGRGRSS